LHERSFPAGASVITADQPGEVIYVIRFVSAKVRTTRPDVTEVILAVLGPGKMVGEMSLADSLGRSADVVTPQESVFLLMDQEAFRATAEEVPDGGRNLTRVLCRRLRLANTHSRMLCTLHVPGRVATQILALAHEYGELLPTGALHPRAPHPERPCGPDRRL
jgi:CRP/FNR family transcriptional regulator, cyclic AMP receptor protein